MATPPDPSDIAKGGLLRPPEKRLLIRSAPRLAQYYWINFPKDAHAPEFFTQHPGIVIRAAQSMNDTCSIVPLTSSPQPPADHVHLLATNPNPRDKRQVWAICTHIYTIALSRLVPVFDGNRPVFPRADRADMEAIFECIRFAFPHVFGGHRTVIKETKVIQETTETVIETT